MALKKYFIAIVIPEPLFSKVEGVKQQLYQDHQLKGALRSPSHITLHRPFEWKEEKEAELINKLNVFRFNQDFDVEVSGYDFFEPRVIFAKVIENPALKELHTQLTRYALRELRLFNEAEDERGFHPHITVAFRDLKKPKFYALKETFETEKIDGQFAYSGFSLLKLDKKWEAYKQFTHKKSL